MRPIKYLPAQLSPEDLEAEQRIRMILDGRDKRTGWRLIQEAYDILMAKKAPFVLEDIKEFVPQHSINHIRMCLTDEQKLAMRRLRDSYQAIQRAFQEVQEEGGVVNFTEIGRRAGCSSTTARYNMTAEQVPWVEENSSW
jgi:hypothetical protein